jgi:hypothetical protein
MPVQDLFISVHCGQLRNAVGMHKSVQDIFLRHPRPTCSLLSLVPSAPLARLTPLASGSDPPPLPLPSPLLPSSLIAPLLLGSVSTSEQPLPCASAAASL